MRRRVRTDWDCGLHRIIRLISPKSRPGVSAIINFFSTVVTCPCDTISSSFQASTQRREQKQKQRSFWE